VLFDVPDPPDEPLDLVEPDDVPDEVEVEEPEPPDESELFFDSLLDSDFEDDSEALLSAFAASL